MRLADIVWFVFSAGGAVTMMLVFALWLLMAPKAKRLRRLLAATAIFYLVTSLYPLPHAAARWLGRSYTPIAPGDVPAGKRIVVLLGSGSFTLRNWSGDELSLPDLVGAERAIEAARAFKLLDADQIISSGGRVDPNDPDEPSGLSMRALLVFFGVPTDRIVIERESRDTHDEAVLIRDMMRPGETSHVILVTSPVHMRRSLAVFRKAGLDVVPAIAFERDAADDWLTRYLPSTDGLRESGAVAHELLGFVYYKLRGWI